LEPQLSGGQTKLAVRENADARAAIVAAAEALFRRGGADAVTLSAVAREVDFARGVVYAHFSSRAELVAAARQAAGDEAVEMPDEAVVPAPEPVAASVADGESYDSLMRAQADVLQELSRAVIVAKPTSRDGADAAMVRFDARLAVTEKSLAALEQRTGERLKQLDIDTGSLAERLHGLRQRLEKFEEKQTTAVAQLRLDLHNLRPAGPGRIGPEPTAPVVRQPDPIPERETDEAAVAPIEAPVEAEDASSARMADYLVSARRSAIDAEKRRAVPVRRKPAWKRFLGGKRRWAILAAVAALVAWFDIYVFAHYQPAEGAVVPAVAAPLPVVPAAARAPAEWSPRAQLVRGLKYLNGIGVPADAVMARGWIERAALRHQPVAENLMGVLYQTGNGVAVNLPVAIGWYEGAARRGNLKAMTNLGKVYAGGWPEGIDFVKAAEWFAKAAAAGEVDAAFDLAILYERGEGVTRDLPQAYKWYTIAAALGDAHARTRAAILAAEITPDERQAADTAVAAFKPEPVDQAANDIPNVSG